jgi:glycosyltransferase involved in cell wall biosynthesis
MTAKSDSTLPGSFRIAYCLPVFRSADTSDTSILLQMLLMEKLKDRGHTLTIVSPKDLVDVLCITDQDNLKVVIRTWSNAGWYKLIRRAIWKLQQRLGVPYLNVFSNLNLYDACLQCLPGNDIVQERIGIYKMGVAMACKHLHLPYILFFDADDILEHDLFGRPLEGILRWRAKGAIRYNLAVSTYIICVSVSAKKHLMNTWQVPEEKIAVFPNAVDVNHFRPEPGSRSEIRARFGVGDSVFVIFVGSFFPYQDVRVLLEAYARILREYPRVRLVLVGDGEQYRDMVRYASTLGLDGSVSFTGFLPHAEIPSLISASDIAVAPYAKIENDKFLGSSMKLVEYMASGTAVIASDIGQINEVVQNGVNGLLVAAGDVDALAGALKKLIASPHYRMELGRQAREFVIQRYSWDNYISRLEDLYISAIGKQVNRRTSPQT